MKKILVMISSILVLSAPVMAQTMDLEESSVPVESLTLKKGDIPPQIIIAAQKLFEGDTQVAWGKFPYELKDYGWNVDKNAKEPITRYEIKMEAKDGSSVYAVFEPNGDLVRSKIVNNNAAVPKDIAEQIKTGEYKDWHIIGDVMLIKNNPKEIVDHYAVTIAKGNQTKTLYFKTDEEQLAVR